MAGTVVQLATYVSCSWIYEIVILQTGTNDQLQLAQMTIMR